MNQQEIVKLFEDVGVILHGHFILTSGKHSPTFLQCAQLMQYPEHAEAVAKELAAKFKDTDIDLVVGPAMGGIVLAYEVARQLGCKTMFAEKDGDAMRFRRGFKLEPNTKVLVVEDAVSTGGSVRKVLDACQEVEADIVGVGILVDRSAGKVKLHENQHALVNMEVPAYDPADCPLCEKDVKLVHPKDLGM